MNFGKELCFQNLTEESQGDKVLNTNLMPEIVGTYPLQGSHNLQTNLLEIHPILVVRTQLTSFCLESIHVLFRKATLNVTLLHTIA